jgi:uncharacterized protein (TIGR02453 family)
MANQQKNSNPQINISSFKFLNDLKKNNNRDWFNGQKDEFLKQQAAMEAFADALLQQLSTHDLIETPSGKKSMRRIYRDVRFSTNKAPYKTNWNGHFTRATKYRRGGYYYHIEPGNTFVVGGFFNPNPQDLKVIREDIAFDASPLRVILNNETFIASFETLKGEQVKTTPKGFQADDEAIDLLRYKQFLLVQHFTDDEVLSAEFVHMVNQSFKNMRPFFDYMSDVLSTDVNGVKI